MFFLPGALPSGESVFFLDVALLERTIDAGAGDVLPTESTIDRAANVRAVLDCPPVLEVFARLKIAGPCLCCFYTDRLDSAHTLSKQLTIVLRYVRAASMTESRSAGRIRERLSLDSPHAATFDASSLPGDPGVRRAHRECRSVGVEMGFCPREGRVWFAKGKALSRFLRKVASRVKKQGGAFQVHPAKLRDLMSLLLPAPIQAVTLHECELGRLWEIMSEVADQIKGAQSASHGDRVSEAPR
jgi:hypothetical protein